MGWVGNVFLVLGLWLVGDKKRSAFIFSCIGETIWVFHALSRQMYDLAFICVIFALLAIRSWFKWGKE